MKTNLKTKLFNSKLSKEEFFKNYWNKKPYHFKSAIKNTENLGDFDDFFEMSFDQDFETRLVYETGGEYPWQAKRGPFKKADFKKNALWTLICHNLELFNPDLFQIKENLDFLSSWHFDDVMATISKKGASVGAHIDDYSVFIFQGKGKRKWMLQSNPNNEYIEDLDIRILKSFTPDTEIILEPGDMIYIPPNVAHHGISLDDSISYSIGFKSIRFEQFFQTMLMIDDLNLEKYNFHEHKNTLAPDRFIITDKVINDFKNDLLNLIDDKNFISKILLNHLSKTKNEIYPADEVDFNAFLKLLPKMKFKRDIWSKMVSVKLNKSNYQLMINNKEYILNSKDYSEACNLFSISPHGPFKIKVTKSKTFELFLWQIYNDGILFIE